MVDLHMHSNCSDGTSTVIEILTEAERKGLSVMSITDHDVIDGYEQLKNHSIRNIFSGKVITGVEITTTVDGELVELLGYGYDWDKLKTCMVGKIFSFQEYKVKEFASTIATYKKNGIILNENNIQFNPKYESCRKKLMQEIFSYQENIDRLIDKFSKDNFTSFSRNEFYNPKSDFYVDQSQIYISFQDAIDLIHEAGGYVFLAHPFVYSKNVIARIQSIIDRYNIDGIECFYYSFTEEQTAFLLDVCKKNNLLISGGSDYHGEAVRPGDEIGIGNGNLKVDESKTSIWTDKLVDFR